MRVAKACRQCRAGKRKCIPAKANNQPCTQCLQRKQSCSLTVSLQKNQPKTIAPGPQSLLNQPALVCNVDNATRDQLVDLYLQLIHDKPHTMFHPPTLLAQVREETLPKAILFGIMGLAARFSDDPGTRQQTKEFFQLAKEFFKIDSLNVSLENIQASVLVGNICGAEGQPQLESLFFGIAFRLAQILRLPTPSPQDGPIKREIKLRVWWSLYMIDQWSSAGLGVPRQLTDGDRYPLPMMELKFWQPNLEALAREDTSDEKFGLWGYMIILAKIFGRIQNLHQSLANAVLNDADAENITNSLSSDLESFIDILPSDCHFSVTNLKSHAALGLGRAFVALHLGYHHYATLLYFPYLDVQLRGVANKSLYASRCKHHAAAFSDLLKLSHEIKGCGAVYFIVAHMTVVSSAALLHTLLFGEHEELTQTRSRLYENFATLMKLKEYWPAVEMMIERLFTFQKACMRSMEKIYTVDKWIVKFLLQHSFPIEESSSTIDPQLSERGKVANDTLSVLRQSSMFTTHAAI